MLMKPILAERVHNRNALLDKAADLLRERGWCQGTGRDSWGRLCTIGALGTAFELLGLSGKNPLDLCVKHDAFDAMYVAAGLGTVTSGFDLAHWNDDLPGRWWVFGSGKKIVLKAFEDAKGVPL